jgi:hypothetical protein
MRIGKDSLYSPAFVALGFDGPAVEFEELDLDPESEAGAASEPEFDPLAL